MKIHFLHLQIPRCTKKSLICFSEGNPLVMIVQMQQEKLLYNLSTAAQHLSFEKPLLLIEIMDNDLPENSPTWSPLYK